MDTFAQPGYYKKLKHWIKSVFTAAGRHEREDESEEVENHGHRVRTGHGEEIEELVEGSL